jgi:hypothetical protein
MAGGTGHRRRGDRAGLLIGGNDQDLEAISNYLRTLAPVHNQVGRRPMPARAAARRKGQ